MRTATGLALIAIGAILAFAITASPSFLNLQVAGWILILTGVAGLFVPRRGYGWLRRRVVRRWVPMTGGPRSGGAGCSAGAPSPTPSGRRPRAPWWRAPSPRAARP